MTPECTCFAAHNVVKLGHSRSCFYHDPLHNVISLRPCHSHDTHLHWVGVAGNANSMDCRPGRREHNFAYATYADEDTRTNVCCCGVTELDYQEARFNYERGLRGGQMSIDASMYFTAPSSIDDRRLSVDMVITFGHENFTIWPHKRHAIEKLSSTRNPFETPAGHATYQIHLAGKYFGLGYQGGNVLFYISVAEYIESRFLIDGTRPFPIVMYYGAEDERAERFDTAARDRLKQSYFSRALGYRPDLVGTELVCDFCSCVLREINVQRFWCPACNRGFHNKSPDPLDAIDIILDAQQSVRGLNNQVRALLETAGALLVDNEARVLVAQTTDYVDHSNIQFSVNYTPRNPDVMEGQVEYAFTQYVGGKVPPTTANIATLYKCPGCAKHTSPTPDTLCITCDK